MPLLLRSMSLLMALFAGIATVLGAATSESANVMMLDFLIAMGLFALATRQAVWLHDYWAQTQQRGVTNDTRQ